MLINTTRSMKPDEPKLREVLSAIGSNEHHLPWPLPNMKPSSENDFWGWRSSYGFSVEIWAGQKKVVLDGEDLWANLLVYYVGHSQYIDGGFVVAVNRRYLQEKVHYFTWRACDHVFHQKNIGNCWNLYTCEKCGKSFDVDSSG